VSIWHASIIRILRQSGLFTDVQLAGGKVRAFLSQTLFLDIHYGRAFGDHYDPTSGSYSYALIDPTLPYPGDNGSRLRYHKRALGWDDFPHPDYAALTRLASYPHHFQERLPDGTWRFTESIFRGEIETEIMEVINVIRQQRASGEG